MDEEAPLLDVRVFDRAAEKYPEIVNLIKNLMVCIKPDPSTEFVKPYITESMGKYYVIIAADIYPDYLLALRIIPISFENGDKFVSSLRRKEKIFSKKYEF